MFATPDLPEAHSSTDMVYTAHSRHGPNNYFAWSSQSLETINTFDSSETIWYSKLPPEKRRIDFVLVHKNRPSEDIEDENDRRNVKHRGQDELRRKFFTLLENEGFIVQTTVADKIVYTCLHCPFKRLCLEAERVKFEMPVKDCPQLPSENESCLQKLKMYFETDNQEDFITTGFSMNKIDKFEGYENPDTFFRPSVRSLLTYHILINLNIDDAADEKDTPQKKKGLPFLLMDGTFTDAFSLHEESEKSITRGDNYLPAQSKTQSKHPLESDPRKDLDDTWPKPFKFQPMWKIRDYFGERIALYFAWSGLLVTSLWIPTLFGISVFIYGLYERLTESFKQYFDDFKRSFDNSLTPYFGLVICIWGTIFLELWKRENAELAYEWDVEQFELNEPDRPEFIGTKQKQDPVTDDKVWYYPIQRQIIKFTFSASVLLFMVLLVIGSVVGVIVYRVIISIDYCPDIGGAKCLMLATVVSSILNAVSILILGKLYTWLARKLTEWENHRTQTKFDDALIFKLFAFQFVNSYASCYYIAFFRGRFSSLGLLGDSKYDDSCEGSCMAQLSFQILVLMLMKPLPKFIKDVVIVGVIKLLRKHPNWCLCFQSKCPCWRSSNQINDLEAPKIIANTHLQFIQHEHKKPTLGDFTFDEYMEKILQYGFLMLFATSFPLAPLLALLTNLFDLRVDALRLLWWYRRPVAYVAQDIGMWYDILLFVNFCGVVSNAFIVAFTSHWGSSYSIAGKLIIVIGFEHIVFALKYLVAYIIPDVPGHVQLSMRRERYLIQKKMEESSEITGPTALGIRKQDEVSMSDVTAQGSKLWETERSVPQIIHWSSPCCLIFPCPKNMEDEYII
ncbi:hypothetical protein C0Q70_06499 [Pomacea canaliculata]|uniref:Anoctamin n=1 Tax=Pomacea canaliculata TaxID=400727 RepID=A0A2T7PP81_POMCA|nr:hypothetical protein C0Q70_06499 [Pomacea canaliculata]